MIAHILLTLASVQALSAEAVYPIPVAVRFLGSLQGATGSCMSEAAVGAMEHAFAARGLAVKLSTYYAHAYNRRTSPDPSTNQQYLPEDAAIFNSRVLFVPNFMLPEDGRGLRSDSTAPRPAMSRILVDTTGFPPIQAFGFGEQFLSFQPGFSNSQRDIGAIKQMIRERQALSLSIHGEFFRLANSQTGLLEQTYNLSSVLARLGPDKTTQHAVALVGFDDALYTDLPVPGAFIVRNSWNENGSIKLATSPLDGRDPAQVLLRGKISSVMNEPGYYAVPYQYVIDLMNAQIVPGRIGEGGIKRYWLNYEAYAAHYFQHESRYEILKVPFACNWGLVKLQVQVFEAAMKKTTSDDPGQIAMGQSQLRTLLDNQRLMTGNRAFGLASLSRSRDGSVDRIRDFYAGAFDAFYCPNARPPLLPSAIGAEPRFQEILREITLDPRGMRPWMLLYGYLAENPQLLTGVGL